MNVKWFLYLLILSAISAMSIIRWRQFHKGERIIGVLICVTLVSELCSLYATNRWQNNLPLYHFFNPIQFFLISLYFNCSISLFRKRSIGLLTGIAGVALSILNTVFLQPLQAINSYFLLFEAGAIALYCLAAIYEILMDEDYLPYRFVHFWVTLSFLLYWSSTFTGWGLYELLRDDKIVVMFFDKILTTANFVFYLGIGITLALYHKLTPACA